MAGWPRIPIPSDQSRWGRFDALQESNRIVLQEILEAASADKPSRSVVEREIGDYYAACMDEKTIDAKGMAPIKPDLDRIAAMRDKAAIHRRDDPPVSRSGSAPFFRFSSSQDAKDSTQVIAGLDQGGLGLPDRDYYFKTDEKSVDIRKKYVAHVAADVRAGGRRARRRRPRRPTAVMAIETALAKGSLDSVSRRDPNKVYHKLTVKELASLSPGFDWPRFFEGVGAPPIDSLNVDVPPFIEAMESVIVESSLDDLKTYLTWQLLHDSVPTCCPLKFQQETFEFYGKTLSGAKEMRARWKRCVDQTDGQLPDALGQKFVEKTLGEEGKRRTQQMVNAIEKAMARGYPDARLDDARRPKSRRMMKLHAVMNKIGTKEHWMDYSKVKIARDDAYGNAERTSQFELHRQLAKIGKPVDKTDWEMSQPTVNAYYDPQENDINFPAGILQPPFWDNKMDDAVNYGAIGAVIGHELTHGFDDQGRQFDAQGQPARLVDRAGCQGLRAARAVSGERVFRLHRGRRREAERQADARREYRRQRRLAPRLHGADGHACRQGAAQARRIHRRAALVPRLGADLVREPHRRIGQDARAGRSALARGVSRERRGLEHARVSEGVRLQGGPADGAQSGLPGLVVRTLLRIGSARIRVRPSDRPAFGVFTIRKNKSRFARPQQLQLLADFHILLALAFL